mmetsp:Transcript_31154/g.26609  ORF Transcript_31154/g.26609 Transcript_31154/m.26609 type:complete len:81 (-) Transcript_31154:16-258(-)
MMMVLPIIYDINTGYALCGDSDILSIALWSKGYPPIPNKSIKYLRGGGRHIDYGADDINNRSFNDWFKLILQSFHILRIT